MFVELISIFVCKYVLMDKTMGKTTPRIGLDVCSTWSGDRDSSDRRQADSVNVSSSRDVACSPAHEIRLGRFQRLVL